MQPLGLHFPLTGLYKIYTIAIELLAVYKAIVYL